MPIPASHFLLGSCISNDGYATKDMRSRIAMGKAFFMDKQKLLTAN